MYYIIPMTSCKSKVLILHDFLNFLFFFSSALLLSQVRFIHNKKVRSRRDILWDELVRLEGFELFPFLLFCFKVRYFFIHLIFGTVITEHTRLKSSSETAKMPKRNKQLEHLYILLPYYQQFLLFRAKTINSAMPALRQTKYSYSEYYSAKSILYLIGRST